MATWRDHAAKVIGEVISETLPGRHRPFTDNERKALRKALREAYPYGQRAMHPYKVWCSEVKRQLGEDGKPARIDARQAELFGRRP